MVSFARDVIKGNNLTQCYIEATAGCGRQGGESPTATMQDWEKVIHDLYQMCDGSSYLVLILKEVPETGSWGGGESQVATMQDW